MDFLDSLDVELPKHKKSRRVRSWYLYEQFKSLEHNQLDATRKLKSRSYQDRILRQELCERKARRNLYDQYGRGESECAAEHTLKSDATKTSLDVSSNDFFESFHELEYDEELTKIGDSKDYDEQSSCPSVKYREEEFKSVDDDRKDDDSYAESVINVLSEETLIENVENEETPREHNNTSPHVELNFDVVKERLQCLERLAHMNDLEKFSEIEDSLHSNEEDDLNHVTIMHDKNVNTTDKNVHFMWSKLVSFAYQIMELNHGNCYYDYGSQLLTAVLACDVLRRGINKVFGYLQPYVSPLPYSIEPEISNGNHKTDERKNGKTSEYIRCYKRRNVKKTSTKLSSEYLMENSLPVSREINAKRCHRASEPGRRFPGNKWNACSNSYQTIWPCFSCNNHHSLCVKTCTRCCQKVVNPMLHVSRYLDKIMVDIDDV